MRLGRPKTEAPVRRQSQSRLPPAIPLQSEPAAGGPFALALPLIVIHILRVQTGWRVWYHAAMQRRLFVDDCPASPSISRLRAEGVVTSDMASVVVAFGQGGAAPRREIRVSHCAFPNGGQWSCMSALNAPASPASCGFLSG